MKKQFTCDGYVFDNAGDAMRYAFSKLPATPAEERAVASALAKGLHARYGSRSIQKTIYQSEGQAHEQA